MEPTHEKTLFFSFSGVCISACPARFRRQRSHVVHQAFEAMSKEVNQLSNGDMKIRIYPSSQMGSARETMELLQNGALDMTKGSASDLESFDNVYAIYNLPFLFKDQNHFNKVVFGDVGKEIMESTKDKGFFALSAYVAGTRSFYAKKPITKPGPGQPDNLKNGRINGRFANPYFLW